MQLSSYDIECINSAKLLIDKDTSRHYTIDTIAVKSNIGKTKLKGGFKQLYGMGLYTYLRERRMKISIELLGKGDKTLKQIAKATGFKYVSNFITAFKAHYNITPHNWRKAKHISP